jgi:hypothetical protein
MLSRISLSSVYRVEPVKIITYNCFFYLYKEHGVSAYDADNLSPKRISSAFSAVFGRSSAILMEKFNSEIKSA